MSSNKPDLATLCRHTLADALIEVGPQAPTLCGGWSALDLAAHLVVRESSRLNLPTHHDDRILAESKRLPYSELIFRFRSGPPSRSPFSLPGVDALVNSIEYGVHLVDVTRANPDQPAAVALEQNLDGLWQTWQLPLLLRRSLRQAPVPFSLDHGQGDPLIVKPGVPRAVLQASTADALLLSSGRARYAQWTVSGPAQQAPALDYWLEQRKRENQAENQA